MKICIIGGGMAGMICAIEASSNSDNKITIYERQSSLGKKVAITGNGKCNLSNIDVSNPNKYSSIDRDILDAYMTSFDNDECQNFYRSIGLQTTINKGGVYPIGGQASSVVSILVDKLNENGVEIVLDKYIDSVVPCDKGYKVDGRFFDKVVLAFGGKAGVYGENSSCGIEILKSLEIAGVRPAPALCGVEIKENIKNLSGVRTNALISLLDNDKVIYEEAGELQLADYGLSGIPIFNLTNHMPYNLGPNNNIRFKVDYMPEYREEELTNLFNSYKKTIGSRCIYDTLLGLFNSKLASYFLQISNIKSDASVINAVDDEVCSLVSVIKNSIYTFSSLRNYKNAQVMKGGVRLNQLDESFMVKDIPGVYVIGEMMDVSGECGGYNLYFAYHSGRSVGRLFASNQLV